MIFERVGDIVGLEENLVVSSIDRIKAVMMSDQKDNALQLCGGNVCILQKFANQNGSFFLLIFALLCL